MAIISDDSIHPTIIDIDVINRLPEIIPDCEFNPSSNGFSFKLNPSMAIYIGKLINVDHHLIMQLYSLLYFYSLINNKRKESTSICWRDNYLSIPLLESNFYIKVRYVYFKKNVTVFLDDEQLHISSLENNNKLFETEYNKLLSKIKSSLHSDITSFKSITDILPISSWDVVRQRYLCYNGMYLLDRVKKHVTTNNVLGLDDSLDILYDYLSDAEYAKFYQIIGLVKFIEKILNFEIPVNMQFCSILSFNKYLNSNYLFKMVIQESSVNFRLDIIFSDNDIRFSFDNEFSFSNCLPPVSSFDEIYLYMLEQFSGYVSDQLEVDVKDLTFNHLLLLQMYTC